MNRWRLEATKGLLWTFLFIGAFETIAFAQRGNSSRDTIEGGCTNQGISFPIRLLDIEHLAGSVSSSSARSDLDGNGVLGEHTAFYGPNSLTPIEMQWTEAYRDSPDPLGTGYIGLHTSDFTEPFVSFGMQHCAGVFAPAVGVPVKASLAEFGLFNEPESMLLAIGVQAYIGDRQGTSTPIDHWINLGDIFDRNVTLQACYLPGNALESVGMQEASFTEFNSETVFGVWGNPISPQPGAHLFNDHQIPTGPMRVYLKVDGYEPDWLDIEIGGTRIYYWTALLVPSEVNPGPSATDLLGTEYESYPSQMQRDLLIKWGVTGVAEQFTNLESKLDHNADSIWDAADLVHNSLEETAR